MFEDASSSRCVSLPLRGYERMMTVADNASVKVSHVMVLCGSADAVSAFLKHGPQALALTFNKHPRMRVKQVRGQFAMAEVHPAITTQTVLEDKLFGVREVASDPTEKWESYVESESNTPTDRYTSFPFYLRVWHYPNENNLLRLMLFSDHYMSDGITGLTVLNDVLEFASTLSRDNRVLAPTLPLRPTLYDMWLTPKSWWSLTTSEWIVSLFGKMVFSSEMKNFTPVIPVRSDQSHFQVPIKINTSSALFGQGTRENMLAASKRCKEEGVTFFGALAASIVVAFYIAKHGDKELMSSDPLFKLAAELDYNMRRRVEHPAPEAQVGCYFTTAGIERVSKEGVDMPNTRFWDLAREVKKSIDEQVDSFLTPFQLILVDQHVHTETIEKFARDVKIPNSVASDVDISNVGKYPHKYVHAFRTSEGKTSELTIKTVHVHSSVPHLGSAASMYVSSVDTLCYSMMHKYESKDATTLFAAFTTAVDHVGQVSTRDTMLDVVKRVRKQIKKQVFPEEAAGTTGQQAPTAA